MFNWMKNHKKLIAFTIFMVIFGVPLIIHILFKLHPNVDFFVAEWTAGELLSYYGSILAFLGTVILGALSLYQNQIRGLNCLNSENVKAICQDSD